MPNGIVGAGQIEQIAGVTNHRQTTFCLALAKTRNYFQFQVFGMPLTV
jgi:hypothetical protein